VKGFLGLGLLSVLGLGACNLGPLPSLKEPLDHLDPVSGEATSWIAARENETEVLVLSSEGRFLRSIVHRDTYVDVEIGQFTADDTKMTFESNYEYSFPRETGSVRNRTGAQSRKSSREVTLNASVSPGVLRLAERGDFIEMSLLIEKLDLQQQRGRECLLLLVQLSIRTIQARIRNFGGGGTVIYLNNEAEFSGFSQGSQRIILKNILSPDTTISYESFRDFPEIELSGEFISHVNTSGDGTLDKAIRFRVGDFNEVAPQGAGGGSAERVLAEGSLKYGPEDPIKIEEANVVGGSYALSLSHPLLSEEKISWRFLQDLNLQGCYTLPEETASNEN